MLLFFCEAPEMFYGLLKICSTHAVDAFTIVNPPYLLSNEMIQHVAGGNLSTDIINRVCYENMPKFLKCPTVIKRCMVCLLQSPLHRLGSG